MARQALPQVLGDVPDGEMGRGIAEGVAILGAEGTRRVERGREHRRSEALSTRAATLAAAAERSRRVIEGLRGSVGEHHCVWVGAVGGRDEVLCIYNVGGSAEGAWWALYSQRERGAWYGQQ
jgi:hypothetical protein